MNQTLPKPPLEREFDLGRLSDAGQEIVLAPKGAELAALAKWVDVPSVDTFTATVELTRKSLSDFHYAAKIEADIMQECVVTLEPVKSHVSRSFSRELHLSRVARHQPLTEALAPGAGDDETPEEISSPHFDVAGPVLEEFSLAIDPYPRAQGAAFESPADPAEQATHPFAVLGRLKTGN